MGLKRIIMHWSAGAHTVSSLDREHYHFIVSGAGDVVAGDHAPEDNINTNDGYAAHTRGCNTGSIGVAVAAMAGATERPWNPGAFPITVGQLNLMVRTVAELAKQYGIPVTPKTILSHGEVEGTLGIKQRGKWDIAWLPGMDKPSTCKAVGDKLRSLIAAELAYDVDCDCCQPKAPAPGTGSKRPVLDNGDEGDTVRELQKLLGVGVDGDFGDETEAAVRQFQREHGLTPDGVVGKLTWAALLS